MDLRPRRGAPWVAGQLGLLAACALAGRRRGWPRRLRRPLGRAGGATIAAGSGLALAGARGLGADLTPLPDPRPGAALRTAGVYGHLRHPVYAGLVLLAGGWALARSPRAVPPAAALALLLRAKARREEAALARLHPGYAAYRARVPGFVPAVRRPGGPFPGS